MALPRSLPRVQRSAATRPCPRLRIVPTADFQCRALPMSREITITQWHVPIDDRRHYWYAIFTSFDESVNKDEMSRQRLELYELPDYSTQEQEHFDLF